jgi:hypothetical protein
MEKRIAARGLVVLLILASGCSVLTQPNRQARNPLFAPAQGFPLSLGGRPQDVAVADLNRDGKLDVVTCLAEDKVSILLGDGRGGFTPAPDSPVKRAAHLVAIGDVNSDGNPDLALTHHDSFGVEILLGTGDGRFSAAPGSPFAAYQGAKPHNHGLALNDLNSDGKLDITTSNQDDNSVSVLLGDGRGSFKPAGGSPFAVGRAPYPHAVGDVNRDGKPDIAAPNVGSNNVTVLLGDGNGGFKAAAGSPYTVSPRPYYVAIGDISGDGNPDLIMTHDDIHLITTLLGDGRGGFAPSPTPAFDLGSRGYEIIAANVTGDARAELVIGTEANDSVAVLLGSERGSYTHAAGSPYKAGRSQRVAVGDVNNDGKADLITANHESGNLTVLLGR